MSQQGPSSAAVLGALAVGTSGLLWWLHRRAARERGPARHTCADEEVLASVGDVRARYDLSEDGGFLPERAPPRLPAAFEAWEALVDELPELNRSGRLVGEVDRLPELDASTLLAGVSAEALRRAFLVLGMLSHSYVHGPEVPWYLIPEDGGGARTPQMKTPPPCMSESWAVLETPTAGRSLAGQLAKPWFEVCLRLKMPPVLTSCALDCWNWEKVDPSADFSVDNLRLACSMTGTTTEKQFHMVPCAMQKAAAEVVPKVFLADLLVRGERLQALADLLGELTDVLAKFREIFGRVPDGVDVDVFYDVYRPLLDGFHPKGLVLQQVEPGAAAAAAETLAGLVAVGRGKVSTVAKGPSAGQSTMIILFDIFLGVAHCPSGAEFQAEMLCYMPEPHRRMVQDYRTRWQGLGSARSFVESRREGHGEAGKKLARAFDDCVHALRDLRRFHLNTVARYLTRTETGTGASSWRTFLQGCLESTEGAVLPVRCPVGG